MPRDKLIQSWTGNAAAWTEAVRGGRIESRRLATDAAILGAVAGSGARGGRRALRSAALLRDAALGREPYRDGWRLEDFSSFGEQAFPGPMAWYFRTLASWLDALSQAGYRVVELREPAHPDTARPLALPLSCAPARAP